MPEFRAITRAIRGVEPWKETIYRYIDMIFHTKLYRDVALNRLRGLYRKESYYSFRDAKLPLLDPNQESLLLLQIY